MYHITTLQEIYWLSNRVELDRFLNADVTYDVEDDQSSALRQVMSASDVIEAWLSFRLCLYIRKWSHVRNTVSVCI